MCPSFRLKTLKKRLFSSPAAFARTLQQHENTLKHARRRKSTPRPTPGILQRQIDRVEEEYWYDDEAEDTTNDAVDTASQLFQELSSEELALLKEMKAWAEKATSQLDAKAKNLIKWLHEIIRPGGKWSNDRVIIFTEYRATQNWLNTILASEKLTGGDKLRFARFGSLREMQEALNAATSREPSERVKEKLLNLWPRNSESLRQALEARMKERTESLKKILAERADKEASDIRTIMTELLNAIQSQLEDPDISQGFLPGLAPAEREQFERNVDALRARVRAIPSEIEREIEAIRSRFADPQPRMFPVAVSYLVPESLAGR